MRQLHVIFESQLQLRFRCSDTWAANDLRFWDHLGTIHRAIADRGWDKIRLMRGCQVLVNNVFDLLFLRPVCGLMAAAF
jgi:taurine dioxygenase